MSSIPMANQIRYWINAVPTTCCALFEDELDLVDGLVLLAMTCKALCIESVPDANTQTTPAGHCNATVENEQAYKYREGYFHLGKYNLRMEPKRGGVANNGLYLIGSKADAHIFAESLSPAQSVERSHKAGHEDLGDKGAPISKGYCSRSPTVCDKSVACESTKAVLESLKNRIAVKLKASEKQMKMSVVDESNTAIVSEVCDIIEDREEYRSPELMSDPNEAVTPRKYKRRDNFRNVQENRCRSPPLRPAADPNIYQSPPSFQRHISCTLNRSYESALLQLRATRSVSRGLAARSANMSYASAGELLTIDRESSAKATNSSCAENPTDTCTPQPASVNELRAFDGCVGNLSPDNDTGRTSNILKNSSSCGKSNSCRNRIEASDSLIASTISGIAKESICWDAATSYDDMTTTTTGPYFAAKEGIHLSNTSVHASHVRHLEASTRLGNLDATDDINNHLPAIAAVDNKQIDSERIEEEKEEQLILAWLSDLGLHAMHTGKPPGLQRWFRRSVQHKSCGYAAPDFKNEWYNGVLLCELCPLLCPLQREEIKKVVTYNRDGHKTNSRLLLIGSETSVRSKAQVLRNMQLSLKSLQRISGMGGLQDYFSAEDILSGRVSVWYVLHMLLHHNSSKKIRKHVKVIHASARSSAISHAFNNGSPHLAVVDCAEVVRHHSTDIDILEHIEESAAISITSKDGLSGCEGSSEGSGDAPKHSRYVSIMAVGYTDSGVAVPSTPNTQQFIDSTDSLNPSSVGTASWSPDSQRDSRDFDESSEAEVGQNSQDMCVANFDDDCQDEASKTNFRRLSTNDRALFEHLATLQEDMERLDQQYDQLNYQNDDHSDHPSLSHNPGGSLNYDIHRSEYELEGEIQKYFERSQQKTPLTDVPNILDSVRTVAGEVVGEIMDMKDLHIADNLSRISESPSLPCSGSKIWTASPTPPPPFAPLSPLIVLTIADDMKEALDMPCRSPPLDIDKKTEVVVTDEMEEGDNATVGITDISSPVSADYHHRIDNSNEDVQAVNLEPIMASHGRHEEGSGESGKQFITLLSLFSQVKGADPWSVEEPSLLLTTPVKICYHDVLCSSLEKPQDADECMLRKTSALTSISSAANNRSERFDAEVLSERLSCIADNQHQPTIPTESRRPDVVDSKRNQISGLTAASVTSENDVRVKQNVSKHDANKEEPDYLAEGGRSCVENKANNNVIHTKEKLSTWRNRSSPLDTDMCTVYQSVITTPYDRNLWRLETVQRTGSDAFNHGELFSGSAASRLIDGLLPIEAEYLDKLASRSAVSEELIPLTYGAVDQDGSAPMTLARRMVVFMAKYSDTTCVDSTTEVNNNIRLPVPVTDETHPLPLETIREGQPSTALMEGPVSAVPKQSPSSLVPPLRHSPAARTGEAQGRPSGIRKREIPLSERLLQVHRVRSGDDPTRAHNPVTASRYNDCRASKGARTVVEGSKKLRSRDSPRAPPAGQFSPVSPCSDRLSRDSLEEFADTIKVVNEHKWMPEKKAMKGRNPRRALARASSKTGCEVRVRDIVVAPALPLLTCRRRVAAVATIKDTYNGDSKLNDVPTLAVQQAEPPIGYSAQARKKKLSELSKTAAGHTQSRTKKRSGTDWLPEIDEVMDMMETHTLENQVVCGLTDGKVSEIKDWLLSLGLCVLDREGGCGTYPLSSYGVCANSPDGPLEPLALSTDRMRNGELLCDLLLILEPATCSHLNLAGLVHRQPRRISQATENIRRAQWILKLCRHSNIAVTHLSRPVDVSTGDLSGLWGLFGDIMRSYPEALETHFWSPITWRVGRYPYLPYSASEKRSLDVSLTHWLLAVGVITPLTATDPHRKRPPSCPTDPSPSPCSLHSSITQYSTLLAWEGSIRNGTALCDAAEWVVQTVTKANQAAASTKRSVLVKGSPTFSSHVTPIPMTRNSVAYRVGQLNHARTPRTLAQCVANVQLCISSLRCLHGMSVRYLGDDLDGRNGKSNDPWDLVVRGSWDVVWGLLEDMRRCVDGLPPRPLFPADGIKEIPYLGLPQESLSFTKCDKGEAVLGAAGNDLTEDSNMQEVVVEDECKATSSDKVMSSTRCRSELFDDPYISTPPHHRTVLKSALDRDDLDNVCTDIIAESETKPKHCDIRSRSAVCGGTVDASYMLHCEGSSPNSQYSASFNHLEFDHSCSEASRIDEEDALQWLRGKDIIPKRLASSLPLPPTRPAAFITFCNETALIELEIPLMSSPERNPTGISTAGTYDFVAQSLDPEQDYYKTNEILQLGLDSCHACRIGMIIKTNEVKHRQPPIPGFADSDEMLRTPLQGHTTSQYANQHCSSVGIKCGEGASKKHKKAVTLIEWFEDLGLPLHGRERTSFLRGGDRLSWDTVQFVCDVLKRLECIYSGSELEQAANGEPLMQNENADIRLRKGLSDVASRTTSRSLRHACECEGVLSAIIEGNWGAIVTLLSALRVAYAPSIR